MGFKAMILLTRRDDMAPEQFARWWLDEHAPLAAQLPGVRGIRFNLVDDGDGPDGIAELWFDSRDAFDAAYATEVGKRVAADARNDEALVKSASRQCYSVGMTGFEPAPPDPHVPGAVVRAGISRR
ncbi:MAG: EthD family reductase [Microbacterium sp.]|uniref:EthD family reductase n=1 Tax=Microbacterium sp. TaxID=51671 RepID=UPI0039E310E7